MVVQTMPIARRAISKRAGMLRGFSVLTTDRYHGGRPSLGIHTMDKPSEEQYTLAPELDEEFPFKEASSYEAAAPAKISTPPMTTTMRMGLSDQHRFTIHRGK